MIVVKENGLSILLNQEDFTSYVTRSPDAKGNVFIPRSIEHDGQEYFITQINEDSFKNNKKIKKILFDDNSCIHIICKGAFSYSSLSKISFPANLNELQEGWCIHANNLTNRSISPKNANFSMINSQIIVGKSDENKEIFDVLYFVCRNIKNIDIPSSIKHISPFSFCGCVDLKSIEFLENSQLESIDRYSFAFTSFEKILIPSNVKEIDEFAFFENNYLKEIDFVEDSQLYSIKKDAFLCCPIEKLTIPSKVDDLQDRWCINTPKLNNVFVSLNNKRFKLINSKIIIGKSDINNENSDVVYFACRDIDHVFIPSTIKYINSFAFADCCQLKIVEFDENVDLELINEGAFAGSAIEMIKLPDKMTEIKKLAFHYCQNLKIVEFGENSELAIIHKEAFCHSGIEIIEIPKNVEIIDEKAFSYCEKLEIIQFKEGSKLKTIGKSAFSNSAINSISIPPHVKVIEEFTFASCSSLQKIEISEDSELISIEKSAFSFSNLEKLFIPQNLKDLKEGWCYSTLNLSSVEISPKNEYFSLIDSKLIHGKFDNCIYFACRCIVNVTIPSSIEKISSFAFCRCVKLERVDFKEDSKLQSIGHFAFSGSSIKSVFIKVIGEC